MILCLLPGLRIWPPSIYFSDSTDIAFAPHGDYWKHLRRICVSELLSAKRVESFRSLREEQVSELIDRIGTNTGAVNLTDEIQSLLFSITAKAAFGEKCKDQERFIAVVNDIVSLAGGFYVADLFPSIKSLQWITGIKSTLERVHQETDVILGNIIDQHKEKKSCCKSDDLVDVLLSVQEHGDLQFPFTDDNIKAVLMVIFTSLSSHSVINSDKYTSCAGCFYCRQRDVCYNYRLGDARDAEKSGSDEKSSS